MPKNKYQKTPEEFKQRIDELSDMAKSLVNIALGMKGVKTGKANVDVTRGGQVVKKTLSRRDVLEIRDDYISQLRELEKVFRRSKKGKGGKSTTVGRGITSLIYIDDKLRDFVKRGNFGVVNDKPLGEQLVCLREAAITTRATLSKLFGLYVKHNNLVTLAADNKTGERRLYNILGVDPLMDEFFGAELDEIGRNGAKVRHGFRGKKGYRETPVSRTNYSYMQFATLIKNHVYDPIQDELTTEQKETIKVTWVKRPGIPKLVPDDVKAVEIEITGRPAMSARKHAEIEYNLVKATAALYKNHN